MMISLIFRIAFFFQVASELRQTFVHIDGNAENASGINHGLRCIPQHGVGDDAHGGHKESGDSETHAGHKHSDGAAVLNPTFLLFGHNNLEIKKAGVTRTPAQPLNLTIYKHMRDGQRIAPKYHGSTSARRGSLIQREEAEKTEKAKRHFFCISDRLFHALQYSDATLNHFRAVSFPFCFSHSLVIRWIWFLRTFEAETLVERINVPISLDLIYFKVSEQHSNVGTKKSRRVLSIREYLPMHHFAASHVAKELCEVESVIFEIGCLVDSPATKTTVSETLHSNEVRVDATQHLN